MADDTEPRKESAGQEQAEETIFKGTGSQWVNFKVFFIGFIVLVLGLTLAIYGFGVWKISWVGWTGLIIAFIGLIIPLKSYLRVKYLIYNITTERIEMEQGWLSKSVDNIDMFRITDLRMEQGIIFRMLGIGTVVLISKDATDPELVIAGIRRSREVYERVKKESIRADMKRRVLHMD